MGMPLASTPQQSAARCARSFVSGSVGRVTNVLAAGLPPYGLPRMTSCRQARLCAGQLYPAIGRVSFHVLVIILVGDKSHQQHGLELGVRRT